MKKIISSLLVICILGIGLGLSDNTGDTSNLSGNIETNTGDVEVLSGDTLTETGSISTGEDTTQADEKLAKILIDEETNTIYITGGDLEISTGDLQTETGSVEDEELEDEVIEETVNQEEMTPEEEFAAALAWMHNKGLTMYQTEEEFRPQDFLTREEASKIIGQAYITFEYQDITKNTSCTFSDSDTFNPTLVDHISNVCKWGLFKGDNGKFMPQNTLTKAQAMAVLIRMFEGKMSYELQTPWWAQYYQKGKSIGLTNVEDINQFDHELTRYEIALMIYRLRNIIENDNLKTIALNAISGVEADAMSGSMDPEKVKENLDTLVGGIDPNTDPELLEAIYWMYDNGLTIHKNPTDYKPFETLNRAGGAKIFDKFSNMLGLGTSENYLPNECQFDDIGHLDMETQNHVINVCKKGLIKGTDGSFNPDDVMNKSHFVVSLIRMFEGEHLDETVDPWWQNYFNEAKELGLVSPGDAVNFDNPISRYEVALFLYKFDVKYKMLNNLNNTRIDNEIISTVAGSIGTGDNGKPKANVYVDANLLKDGSFDIGYMEIFGTRYKIVKTSEETYFTDNFVRYGEIFDMVTDESLGTMSFVVSNGYVIESTIRFLEGEKYEITAIEGTNAYYLIENV